MNDLLKVVVEGVLTAPLPPAGKAPDKLGGVFIDSSDADNLTKTDEEGKLSTILPTASAENLGGIKIGRNLSIEADGTLSGQAGVLDLIAGENINISYSRALNRISDGNFVAVAYGFGTYVAIGSNETDSLIARSADGINWTIHTFWQFFPQEERKAPLTCICSDNDGFAIGANGKIFTISKNFSDCLAWQAFSEISAIAFWNGDGHLGTYIIGGKDGHKYYTIGVTTNLSTCTRYPSSLPPTARINSINVAGDVAIFACGDGKLLVVHVRRGELYDEYIFDLLFGAFNYANKTNDGYHAVTASGDIYRASDPFKEWKQCDVVASTYLTGVCYNEGKYYACGNLGLFVSEDGDHWDTLSLENNYNFYLMCPAGLFLILGGSLSGEWDKPKLFSFYGGKTVISATDTKYELVTQVSDGLMSKEDKAKLDAAMRFPDGETGYTLPDAAGRADKLITFDSNGNMDLHSAHDYDKWRNVRIPVSESLSGVSLELPDSSVRANKVIGFNADGKSIEMKSSAAEQVNSDWSATSGKAQILNKPNLSKVALSNNYNDLDNKLVAGTNITIDNNNVIDISL